MKGDVLLENTQKLLCKLDENPFIYKIIYKDDKESEKIYNDLRTAQEEAEKTNALKVKRQYKDNSQEGLFKAFLKRWGFYKWDSVKYENNKVWTKSKYVDWYECPELVNIKLNLPPYKIGISDIDEDIDETTYVIIDTQSGIMYQGISYCGELKNIKEQLTQVLDGTYGEYLYQPFYWDPLGY